ncbi:MAG TPA: hypothetical protein PKA42_03855, partial [Candidatus Paceibacterota bacterium]|nr:hypothetical protein [Candidatus Paceibacterota bacterium]
NVSLFSILECSVSKVNSGKPFQYSTDRHSGTSYFYFWLYNYFCWVEHRYARIESSFSCSFRCFYYSIDYTTFVDCSIKGWLEALLRSFSLASLSFTFS